MAFIDIIPHHIISMSFLIFFLTVNLPFAQRKLAKIGTKSTLYRNWEANQTLKLWNQTNLFHYFLSTGEINSINLPVVLRKPCFYFYSWMFSCNLDECDVEDLNQFKNLSEFFRRGLKPDARTIDRMSCLVRLLTNPFPPILFISTSCLNICLFVLSVSFFLSYKYIYCIFFFKC